jgi:hypothetical protein
LAEAWLRVLRLRPNILKALVGAAKILAVGERGSVFGPVY